MATYTEKQLFQAAPADTAAHTEYTAPSSGITIIKQIIVANTTGTAATLIVNIVPNGGSASAANQIIPTISFAGNTTTTFNLTQVMPSSSFISIQEGTASAITVTASGVEKV